MTADATARLRERPRDLALVGFFVLFAFTSLVMEMYIVFDVDLATCTDPFGRAWHLYASRWDPLFLDTPLWLRIMCGIDGFVFGPIYLALIYGFVRRREWVRELGLMFAAAIIYSTIVYFTYEVVAEAGRADLLMVFVVNLPYTIVPLALAARLWRSPVFSGVQ